ncbi:MAG: hypothetical protein ACSHWS_17055 [Sulfitobacter sp.]
MRFGFHACLLGLIAAIVPNSAHADYVRIYVGPAPIVAPVVAAGPSCPDAMVLRAVHLDTPVEYANFDPVYSARPKKKIIVRRAGQRSDVQDNPEPTPTFEIASGWSDLKEKPVDLRLLIDMRICEGLETVQVLDGQLSLMGQVGHYQIAYDTALSGDTHDAINLYWKRAALFATTPAPDMLGQLLIQFQHEPFNARHAETKNHISGALDLRFDVNIMSEEIAAEQL